LALATGLADFLAALAAGFFAGLVLAATIVWPCTFLEPQRPRVIA
jgi:hypothetical protein